jgi:DNA-binding NtrC family response regulator
MLQLRILCLDDDPTTLKILNLGLNKALPDDQIETCDKAHKALELQSSNPYDIFITDLHMPEMNGMEVIDELKKGRGNTSVIVLTAISEIKTVVEAMSKGAKDFIPKPIYMDLLVEKIEGVRQEKMSLSIACEAEAGLRTIEAEAQNTILELSTELSNKEELIRKAFLAIDSGSSTDQIRNILRSSDQ